MYAYIYAHVYAYIYVYIYVYVYAYVYAFAYLCVCLRVCVEAKCLLGYWATTEAKCLPRASRIVQIFDWLKCLC